VYLEAEFDARGELIDGLINTTVDALMNVVAQRPAHEKPATESIVHQFTRTARARARQHGWNAQDREARYPRHLVRLRHKLAQSSRDEGLSERQAAALKHAGEALRAMGLLDHPAGAPGQIDPDLAAEDAPVIGSCATTRRSAKRS